MYIQRNDNEKMGYHEVSIDPFHATLVDFHPLFEVIKTWGSEGGIPVWRPATIGINSVQLLPEQIGEWQLGMSFANDEAVRLDGEYLAGLPVVADRDA